jgi:hypothetical protein
MIGRAVTGALGLALATVASAQSVTLTEEDGRPLLVGDASGIAAGLESSALAPVALVAEFRRLCLPDPAGAAQRAAGSSLGLQPSDALFPGEGKRPEARVSQWRGPSAILSTWSGDDAGLKGRPIAITSRAYSTTGPYGPFKAQGVQCNLVLALPDFSAAKAVADQLTAAFGPPGKLVVKNTFADGHWITPTDAGPVRVNLTAPSTRGAPQPLHLSTQILAKGSKR